MAISQQQIDSVIKKANIVEVIGKYIDLQKKGRNYVSICPFHDDSDPSMNISPDKNIFKCFVCGTGGNVITFVQEFNNITFFKALSLIANDLKIKIDGLKDFEDKPKYNSKESILFEINKVATNFFNGLLISSLSIKARNYLAERKISESEIEKFKIGFCPKKAKLYDYLIKLGFSKDNIFESGLVYKNGVEYNCAFENRLIFPITDEESNIIGFSGRVIDSNESPKYKNSIENIIFKKSQLAYNFDSAKKEARIKNEIIILEGFMDVISLESIDIKNTVAIMGTNMSEYHIKLFSRVAKKYKLFLDGDKAGVNAALKISQFLLEKNIDVTIIENETGKDPDELVKAGEKNLINQMIENTIHPANFASKYFSKDLDIKNSIKVSEFIDKVFSILKYESNEGIIGSIIMNLSEITKLEIQTIKNIFEKSKKDIKTNIIKSENTIIENNFIPDFDPNQEYINRMMNSFSEEDGSQFDLPENAFETIQKNKIEKKIIQQVSNKNSKHFAEAAIVWNILDNDSLIEELSKRINNIESLGVKRTLNFIIDQYKENKYVGHNWEQIANDIKQLDIKYCEYIFEIKNRHFASLQKALSKKGLDDCFDAIELYRIRDEIESFSKKINSTDDKELKNHFAEQIEELLKDRNKIYDKRRKQ
ncbi:DNA primase [Spiroplasma diminutum]|uniref:DNA primase n=1 Tax=Spiroplasma diminutum CUAS-1 TaxID=1276221 RepID=S5M2H6_9MOLU|nr:DNA primase [Spiroplasma diminutum]AGR42287.1 DNA primase [Spiroplasma diminutum CUAS-1]